MRAPRAAAIGRRVVTAQNGKASHNKQAAMGRAREPSAVSLLARALALPVALAASAVWHRMCALLHTLLPLRPAPPTTPELALRHGLTVETHAVRTPDGYVLEMHRLVAPAPRRASAHPVDMTPSESSDGEGTGCELGRRAKKPPVMMMHGAMLCSEIWVCHPRHNLAVSLARAGHDVWLANRRGNRYAQRHDALDAGSAAFWDYSLDDTIAKDVPAQISHVLKVTGSERVALVGFSQGTTEILACLSRSHALRRRVSCVAAIAATAVPGALRSPVLRPVLLRAPHALYGLFGRRAMLSSVALWQRVLPPALLAALMRGAMAHLFAWRSARLPRADRAALFQHMYSPTSVKQLVHWFQIMSSGSLREYRGAENRDQRDATPYNLTPVGREVRTLALLGGADSLADAPGLARDLAAPCGSVAVLPGYEHMDLLWAPDAPRDVHARVLSFISSAQ